MTGLLAGFATAVAAAVVALLLAAIVVAPRDLSVGDLLRVYPDLVRLLAGLSKDRRVAKPVRWRLLVALAYNAQPINLIPDFIPVIGLVDNVLVTAWAIRSAIRRAGPEIVFSHWRGSPATFTLLCRLCRLRPVPAPDDSEGPEREVAADPHR